MECSTSSTNYDLCRKFWECRKPLVERIADGSAGSCPLSSSRRGSTQCRCCRCLRDILRPASAPQDAETSTACGDFPGIAANVIPSPENALAIAKGLGPNPGVEPGDHRVDVVDRQADRLLQSCRIGRHVGAFEHDGTDVRMTRHQALARLDHVLAGEVDVEVLLLALDQHAEELSPVLGAGDRRIEWHAGAFEMRRCETLRAHTDDADA